MGSCLLWIPFAELVISESYDTVHLCQNNYVAKFYILVVLFRLLIFMLYLHLAWVGIVSKYFGFCTFVAIRDWFRNLNRANKLYLYPFTLAALILLYSWLLKSLLLCLYLLTSLILFKRCCIYYNKPRKHSSSRLLSSLSLPLSRELCSSVGCLKLQFKVSYSPVTWITKTCLSLQLLLNCADFSSCFLRVNWNNCQFLPILLRFYKA